MKQLVILVVVALTFVACTGEQKKKESTTHADSVAVKTTDNTALTASIDNYVSSIKSSIPKLNYKRSLQYSLGDYSFDVSVYYKDNKQVALFEEGHSGEVGYRRLNVFLENDKPVFAELAEKTSMGSNNQFTEAKIYMNGLKVIKAVERKSDMESKLLELPFSPFTADTLGFASKADFLKSALDCSGIFDLPFLEIKKSGDKEYLVLGKKEANSYRVNLQILKDDDLIKKLRANPEAYRGKKIDIHWSYENIKGYERLVYKSGSAAS